MGPVDFTTKTVLLRGCGGDVYPARVGMLLNVHVFF